VREAARRAGVGYGAIQHRRKTHPGFALRWDAAGAMAQEAGDGRPATVLRNGTAHTSGATTGWTTRRCCPRSTR
jgi:hypothetical protein